MVNGLIFLNKVNPINKYIKKNLIKFETISIFFLTLIFSFYNLILTCKSYFDLSFDSQILITWDYTAQNGMFPYRDIYYPYGVVSYFKNVDPWFMIIYLILSPILFSSIFLGLMYIWKNRIFAYLSLVGFFLFIVKYTDIDNFSRYGILVAFSFVFAYFFSKQTFISSKIIFLIGCATGVIFSLVNDQGVYVTALVFILIVINPLLQKNYKLFLTQTYYVVSLTKILLFILGFIVGILPIFLYFLNFSLSGDFLTYIVNLSDFPLYAKTPFIPFSVSIDNLFTYGAIVISGSLVSYRIIFENKKASVQTYVIFLLTIVLFFLELKSLIRSIDKQIIFISLLLYIMLFQVFYTKLISLKENYVRICMYFLIFLIVVFFVIPLHPFRIFEKKMYQDFNFQHFVFDTKNFLAKKNNVCLENNIDYLTKRDRVFLEVVKKINRNNTSVNIFSYLSDPIFYVLFNQKPPYYFTIFESTPSYAQNSNVSFLERSDVNYVVYNKKIRALQDNVPDYARNKILFRYLLTNFEIKESAGDFIIFNKTNTNYDIFNDLNLKSIPEFEKYLLTIDLKSIPKSEGEKKIAYNPFVQGSLADVNKYLKNNQLSSHETLFVFTPDEYVEKESTTTFSFYTSNGKKSSVSFNSCSFQKKCIINMDNIPFFYAPRILSKVTIDSNLKGSLAIIKNKEHRYW